MYDKRGAATHDPILVSAVVYREPVGKKLSLSADCVGVEKETLLAARATEGRLENRTFATAAEVFQYRLSANPTKMFLSGTFDPAITEARVVPEDQLRISGQPGRGDVVAATKNYLSFRQRPGLISIDVDVKSAAEVEAIAPTEGVPAFQTAQEVVDALCRALPEAEGCPVLVMPSSSSMIKREEDGELLKGPGGWRILLPTLDASQTPRILKAIHTRCWARGVYCFAFVSRGGDTLLRSLADQALARPTQPDYPTATLGPGLRKTLDVHLILNEDSELFDPATAELSPGDARDAACNGAQAKAELKPDRLRVRVSRKSEIVTEMVGRGVVRSVAARAASMRLEGGILLAPDVVVFEGGEIVEVAKLLSPAGEGFDQRVCLDPVEPDYGGSRCVGKSYWNEGRGPGVHSFAHGSRFYKMRYDERTAIEAILNAGSVREVVVQIVALSELSDIETRTVETEAARALGLGNSRRELRSEVARVRRQSHATVAGFEEDPAEFGQGLLPQGLGAPLAAETFPQLRAQANGRLEVVDHPANLAHILDRYGIQYRYNQITKRMEWEHPEIPGEGDNAENRLFSELVGLASLNSMPKPNLDNHLLGLGDGRSYNPVTDYLSSLEWDGNARIGLLAQQFNASDPEVAQIALRVFLIQACAAADHAEVARAQNPDIEAHFEYVIVLLGEQGAGKTKGFKKLLPKPLRQYYREGQVLNLSEKDSVKGVLSAWVVELGELDATFGKSAVAHKKAFLSQSRDEIRAPYAHKASMYGRRTVFVGTVNEESFLADETGNRRYIPLTVGKLELALPDHELTQLWAEAWHRYRAEESWWPEPEEEEILKINADKYRVRTEIEERIVGRYAWGHGPKDGEPRKTASEIYSAVMPPGARAPHEKDLKTVGATPKRQWLTSGMAELRGGQLVVKNAAGQYVCVNAQSGKNRGWLLPPLASELNTTALFALEAKQARKHVVDK